MPRSSVIVPQKDAPRWLYEILRHLGDRSRDAQAALDAIGRGEAPDGSGMPLVDTGPFFYLPGRTRGQISYQSDPQSPTLTMTQPVASSTATELLRFDTPGKMVKFKPGTFTKACTTDGSTTLAAVASDFVPSGGPTVVPGMLITGTNIPASTYVRHVTSGAALTMTNAASGVGATTVTFEASVDIVPISDETGNDVQWRSFGGIRFTPGTEGIPLRIAGDFSAIASGIAASGRVFLEAGYVSAGVGVGTDLQIGGPGRGELSRLYLSQRVLWMGRNPSAGTNVNVGVVLNPTEYGAGFGPGVNLAVQRTASTGLGIVSGTSSTNASFIVLASTAVGGVSPNKTLDLTSFYFKSSDDGRTWVGNGAGSGFYFLAPSGNLSVTAGATDLNLISVLAGIASWSDSAVSTAVYFGDNTGTSAKRVWFSSAGNGVLDRFGLSSKYILLTDAQAGNADFLAGTSTPLVRIYNSVTVGDTALEVRGMSGQTGHLIDLSQNGTIRSWFAADGTLRIEMVNGSGAGLTVKNSTSGGSQQNSVSVLNSADVEVFSLGVGGEVKATAFFLLDSVSGFEADFVSAGFTASSQIIVPDIPVTGVGTLVLANDSALTFSVNLGSTSTILCNTAAAGAAFKHTSGTQRLRVVLSGAVGANSIVISSTAARTYTFPDFNIIVAGSTAALTSGKIPIATTSGRLTDGPTPLAGTKVYYVSDTSGGAVTRKLTFTDGILTAET